LRVCSKIVLRTEEFAEEGSNTAVMMRNENYQRKCANARFACAIL